MGKRGPVVDPDLVAKAAKSPVPPVPSTRETVPAKGKAKPSATIEGAAAVYMHVSELRRNPKNPRQHGNETVKLARLILRTAFGAPFVVQKRSHTIIAGHGRLDACELILAGMVVDDEQRGGPGHMFDPGAPGPGYVPVRVVDVSDATRDTMTVADNAQGLQGRDDAALLSELLAPHGRGSSILDDMGFNDSVLDGLVSGAGDAVLSGLGGTGEGVGGLNGTDEEPEDPAPDVPVFSRAGEVYELGPHRLVCGDGTKLNDDADVLILDPPFDAPEHYALASPPWRAVLMFGAYALGSEFVASLGRFPHRYQFVWDGVSSWWTPNRPLARHKTCTVLLGAPAWGVDAALIPGDPGPARTVTNSRGSYEYEPIAPDRVRLSTVYSSPTNREHGGHAHSKPVPWVAAMLAGVGAVRIRDPFAGSGTSLIAAPPGASVNAAEIDPRYCDVIRRRWTKFARSAGADAGTGALDP